MKYSWIFLCLALVGGQVLAQTDRVQRSVSVVGEAEVRVAPDMVVFTLEVVTTDKDVATAKKANDIASAKTLEVTRAFRIDPNDVQTESRTISPRYVPAKDPRNGTVLVGYEVTNRMLVTLQDLARIDEFLSRAVEAGVNRVASVDIGNSEIQKHQERARSLAIGNAEAKARAYAKQLGLTLGKAYMIREENADHPNSDGYGSGSGDGTGLGDSGTLDSPPVAFDRPVTFALGQISVEEKIYVMFELNP